MSFVERLRRDLAASAPKTAALGVLLVVGLYFWVPPLWRAVSGGGATAAPGAAASEAAATIAAEPVAALDTADAAVARAGTLGWEEAERLRRADDLFRSASRADVRGDAFAFNDEFLPLEVTFGEDAPDADRLVPKPKKKGPAPPPAPPLKLASTLVSGERRAAVINSKVYTEGETVTAAGLSWTLKNVEPRRVLLEGANGPLELRINPFPTPRLGR